MRHLSWSLLLLLVFASTTLAQGGDCPAIVDAALQTAADACTALSRNQACYGNVTLQAEPQAGASFTFEQTGDMVNLVDVASLSLSAMTDEAWGVALMLLQANLPDTLPGQNVTMVLFGEVDITSAVPTEIAVEPTPEPRPIVFTVTASSIINVRVGPSTSDAVVASLGAGESVPTDGRNEDGTWLHIRFDDGTTGWVFAELVSVDGDVALLPVTDGTAPIVEATEEVSAEPVYTPMQAFYFHSSIGDSGCAEAPDSGMLIQTPQGAGTINLVVNEVEITLGSTAYLIAGDGEMTVNVIEGQGTVSAFDVTVTVPAGTRARIPLDANGVASGAPIGPEPYDSADVAALPIVLLPDAVTITSADDATSNASAASGILSVGAWSYTVNAATMDIGEPGTFAYEVTYDGFRFDHNGMRELAESLTLTSIDEAALAGLGVYLLGDINDGLLDPNTFSVRTSINFPSTFNSINGAVTLNVISESLIEGTFSYPNPSGTFTLSAGGSIGTLQEGDWTVMVVLPACAGNAGSFSSTTTYNGDGWGQVADFDSQGFRHGAALVVLNVLSQWQVSSPDFTIPGNYSFTAPGLDGGAVTLEFSVNSSTSIIGTSTDANACAPIEFTLEAIG